MFDLVALGELLIDFTESGISPSGGRLFEQNAGGAVANMACAACRLGAKVSFIGKVGNDMHGTFLGQTLRDIGVDTQNLVVANDVFTTLAFVALSEDGERNFAFARKPGADTCLTQDELNTDLLSSCRIFHMGSLSMTNEPARSATIEAVKLAKQSGALISYDPNYRAMLWNSPKEASVQMRSLLPYADYVKISGEETELLTGFIEPEKALDALLKTGITCAVVTLGKKGALLAKGENSIVIPTIEKAPVVDTTGAGDAFWGAFISRVLANSTLQDITFEQLVEYVRFANVAATFCIGRRGAIPAMPNEWDIDHSQ